jgi:hypothetical protein
MEAGTFTCSICGEASQDICIFCTKDACHNHLCERCKRCSDCCECEVRIEEVRVSHNGHDQNGARLLNETGQRER